MPELPEVESVAASLRKKVKGKKVSALSFVHPKNILCGTKALEEACMGKTLLDIGRKGKFLLFDFGEMTVISHLRMEGKYRLRKENDPIDPYEIFAYHFADGSKLCYLDVRRFGTIDLVPTAALSSNKSLAKLGPEPMEADLASFWAGLQKRKEPIKSALLDQSLLCGLGNIYADETLFRAKIHPRTPASSLSQEEAKAVLESASIVLQEAIAYGGSTIHSFSVDDGVEGGFQDHLKVYGHKHQACPICHTPFTKICVHGRGTTFCPHCQKLHDAPFFLGVTGPIHAGKSTVSAYFVEKGFALFDADAEVKKLYKSKKVQAELKKIAGKEAVKEGKINAPYLRELFAKSKSIKNAWGKKLDPFLIQNLEKLLEKHPKAVVLDVPLLFSSALGSYVDSSILVYASEEKRKNRLIAEGKDADALLSLNASYPFSAYQEKATILLENGGSEADLKAKLEKLGINVMAAK